MLTHQDFSVLVLVLCNTICLSINGKTLFVVPWLCDTSDEIFQVEIHQACIIVFVFFSKESELVMLIETCCSGKGVDCYKPASCPVSMGENELHTIKHYTAYTLTNIFFTYSKTSDLYSRIVVALLTKRYLTVNAIADAFLCFIQSDDIIQKTIVGCKSSISFRRL